MGPEPDSGDGDSRLSVIFGKTGLRELDLNVSTGLTHGTTYARMDGLGHGVVRAALHRSQSLTVFCSHDYEIGKFGVRTWGSSAISPECLVT